MAPNREHPARSVLGDPGSAERATAVPARAPEAAHGPHPAGAEPLEEVSCPLCSTPPPSRPGYAFGRYRVVRCRSCGLWYLSPRLREEEMLHVYRQEAYFEGKEGLGYSSYLAQEATLRATFRRFLLAMARRGMTGGSLLEVGCAYGFFLDEARTAFSRRVGTDYSPVAAERARRVADAVYVGGVEAIPAGEAYDCIALIHVIEHVYDPRELLRQLGERLRPGGWLVLAAPDMGSFWRRGMGRRWPFFKIPEHVTYFDAGSMPRLLEAVGCREIQPLPYASYFTAALVGEKLRLPVPAWLRRLRIRMPATTVACAGRKPLGSG